MKIDRLPESCNENPALYAAFDRDKRRIIWMIEDNEMHLHPRFSDGINWYTVWREGDTVCVCAAQWYNTQGYFTMKANLVTPDQAVVMADQAAYVANDFIDGDIAIKDLKL